MEIDNERRRIGFRDDGDYGFRNESYDYRDNGDESSRRGGGRYRSESESAMRHNDDYGENRQMSSAMGHGEMQNRSGGGKAEKWHRAIEKIRTHDKKHRKPETKEQLVEIIYDNMPGPDYNQTELLVAAIEALIMHCTKEK